MRAAAILICSVAVAVGGGCSSGDRAQSLTPRVTPAAQPLAAEAALLLAADVSAMGGGPVKEVDLSDMPVFENPDPRGPCGSVLAAYPTTDRAVRIFTAADIIAINAVRPADAPRSTCTARSPPT
jgi:hypothetical protein